MYNCETLHRLLFEYTDSPPCVSQHSAASFAHTKIWALIFDQPSDASIRKFWGNVRKILRQTSLMTLLKLGVQYKCFLLLADVIFHSYTETMFASHFGLLASLGLWLHTFALTEHSEFAWSGSSKIVPRTSCKLPVELWLLLDNRFLFLVLFCTELCFKVELL